MNGCNQGALIIFFFFSFGYISSYAFVFSDATVVKIPGKCHCHLLGLVKLSVALIFKMNINYLP